MSLSSELRIEMTFHAGDAEPFSLTLEAGDLSYFAEETKALVAAALRDGDESALLAWWQRFDSCAPAAEDALAALSGLGGLGVVIQTDVSVRYVNNHEPSMSCEQSFSFDRDGSAIAVESAGEDEWYDHDSDPDGALKVGFELYGEDDFAFAEGFCENSGIPYDFDINDILWIHMNDLDALLPAFVENGVEYGLVSD